MKVLRNNEKRRKRRKLNWFNFQFILIIKFSCWKLKGRSECWTFQSFIIRISSLRILCGPYVLSYFIFVWCNNFLPFSCFPILRLYLFPSTPHSTIDLSFKLLSRFFLSFLLVVVRKINWVYDEGESSMIEWMKIVCIRIRMCRMKLEKVESVKKEKSEWCRRQKTLCGGGGWEFCGFSSSRHMLLVLVYHCCCLVALYAAEISCLKAAEQQPKFPLNLNHNALVDCENKQTHPLSSRWELIKSLAFVAWSVRAFFFFLLVLLLLSMFFEQHYVFSFAHETYPKSEGYRKEGNSLPCEKKVWFSLHSGESMRIFISYLSHKLFLVVFNFWVLCSKEVMSTAKHQAKTSS